MKTIHPAIAEHAMEENERLRGLLRECRPAVQREVEKWTRASAILPVNANTESALLSRIDAALSPQSEPTDAFTATDMINQSAQAFRDGQAATVKDSLTVQPMAYAVFAANGNVVCFSTRRDHPSLVALEADGHSVVSLAPIAQTEQQPSTDALINGAKALLALDESGSLAPHGIGGLAREVIEKLIVRVEQTAPQQEQSGLVGQVCGGDGTHNTVNVAVVGPVPWGDLRIGTPVRLIPEPTQGAGDASA